MEKLTLMGVTLMLLASMFIALPALVHGSDGKDIQELENWLLNNRNPKQKLTKFHFYFHAIPHGKSLNQVIVAKGNITDASPSLFGMLNIVDYPLTEGPQLNSKLVGRAQGYYASVSMTQMVFLTTIDMIFPDGSTITTSGLNAIAAASREMPITGGSGAFRLAQGVVILKPYFFDLPSGNATVEMNVLALHY